MNDTLALWLIIIARKLTSWGYVDDFLKEAESQQRFCSGNNNLMPLQALQLLYDDATVNYLYDFDGMKECEERFNVVKKAIKK